MTKYKKISQGITLNEGRVLGIVQSLYGPKHFYARTYKGAILHSSDEGDTWSIVNGNLTNKDLNIRTIAVHPQNPDIVLAGSSVIESGHLQGARRQATGYRVNLYPSLQHPLPR